MKLCTYIRHSYIMSHAGLLMTILTMGNIILSNLISISVVLLSHFITLIHVITGICYSADFRTKSTSPPSTLQTNYTQTSSKLLSQIESELRACVHVHVFAINIWKILGCLRSLSAENKLPVLN